MPSALIPLANITLGSSASTVTFSSISGSYRDLMLVCSFTTGSSTYGQMRINSDTGSNYYMIDMSGATTYGVTTNSYTDTRFWSQITSADASTSNRVWQINILDYVATDKHKPVLFRYSGGTDWSNAMAGRYASTSAITSVQFYLASGTFNTGSSFALYGVSA